MNICIFWPRVLIVFDSVPTLTACSISSIRRAMEAGGGTRWRPAVHVQNLRVTTSGLHCRTPESRGAYARKVRFTNDLTGQSSVRSRGMIVSSRPKGVCLSDAIG